jgi:tRNA U34 2-thiouridine synthase MnmA/TrmU
MTKNECVILPLLPPSLFPPNTIWELEVRALTPQELLNTAAAKCEVVVSYVRYRPLQELLKRHLPPDRIVQVTAGSYGHGLLRHNTILYVIGFNAGAKREPHVIEVRIKRNNSQLD